MCTLALLRAPEGPDRVLLAANRDEALDRASTGPVLWPDPVPFVGGRDEVAKGTWLGLNARGLLVGLTNHWTGAPADPSRASRGDVVRSLLGCGTLEEAADALASRDPEATNPFLLLAADRRGEAFWAASALGLNPVTIEDRGFALGNRLPETDTVGRTVALREAVAASAETGAARLSDPALLTRVKRHLALHSKDRGPETSVCVHTDRGYGTVSSTIFVLGADPAHDRYLHAPGRPCETEFEDHAALLGSLRGSA